MVSRDINFIIAQLEKRVDYLERTIEILKEEKFLEEKDWDDSTLQKEWKICKRTAANYRQQGLGFYKRGGRIYYTLENRIRFINEKNKIEKGE